MEIHNTPSPHFGAKFISTAQVKKKCFLLPKYKKETVNFVELDRKEDLDALFQYSYKCSRRSFATFIRMAMEKNLSGNRAFALTRQQDNFEKLNPQDIIGICGGMIKQEKGNKPYFYLSHLEARSVRNPYAIHIKKEFNLLGKNFHRREKYKGIGSELIKKIISTLRKSEGIEEVDLMSLQESRGFYRELGMEQGFRPSDQHLTPFRILSKNFDVILER